MTAVSLGRAETAVRIDLDVCVKTGQPATGQVTLRGRATPPWVSALLLLTLVGYLLAEAMTSRRFQVSVPFAATAFNRWKSLKRVAQGGGIVGAMVLVAGLVMGGPTTPWFWAGLTLLVVSVMGGAVNATVNQVGMSVGDHGDLLLTRVHPAFVQALQESRGQISVLCPPGRDAPLGNAQEW